MVGIGGIGMSGIAELLQRNGYRVSGSDLKTNEIVRHLEQLGVRIFKQHVAANIEGAELVVYSSAVTAENPEIKAAREKEIPTIPRAEMLAELMRIKHGIAVAGAHGKTTTTSMIATVLNESGLDPTVVVGGRMDNFGGTNARLGAGEFMVVEADESDGSFNKLSPSLAVVTNIDREHMDFYKTMSTVKKAFLSFLNKVPFYGLCVICGDDPYLKLLHPKVDRRKRTYGFKDENNYHLTEYTVTDGGSRCVVRIGKDRETLTLRVPGRHNALNAVAALAVADELSISRRQALEALAGYQGVQRRFQRRGELKGILFIDDYAHHPNEIRATLSAAREQYPQSKIRVIFQPHRFSRVEDLLEQFATCFKKSDYTFVTDIYAAGEKAANGLSGKVLVEIMQQRGLEGVSYEGSSKEAIQTCIEASQPGDIVLTMGAGDLPNVYRDLF